ncbi:MAG: hypothetical protein BWX88_03321 [Planctomycetes bacterium ADurb.Bin126]|nr:MAG: hypothetical protein BWX88_03321 [Planctomycetes bacterium ADurb.Bin126]HOD80707.1 glycogen-binding domain-containing protein [Phycisphaerae bacterium]HQL75005.1 glycogen-binding domain-containing protein [Phycisphaerae bacterium]
MKIVATIVRESANAYLAWSPSLPENWQARARSFQGAFSRLEDALYAFYDVFLGLPKHVFWLNVLDAGEEGRAEHPRSLVVVTGQEPQPVRFSIRPARPANSACLAGDFNQWKPAAMEKRGENVFTGLLPLRPGVYEYRFVIDGQWAGSQVHLPDVRMDVSQLNVSLQNRHSAMAGT